MKVEGIDIQLTFSSITGYTQQQMVSVDRVFAAGGVYYPINDFVSLFGNSEKTVRRKMSKLDTKYKHYSTVRIGNKLYFNKSLYHSNPSALSAGITEEIDNPTDDALSVTVDLGRIAQFNESNYTTVTGATFDNGLVYYEVNQFQKRFGISCSSVYKYIEKVYKERYRYCISIEGKHYVSPGILMFSKRYLPELKNLEYAAFLNFYTWTVAGTVRYCDDDYHSADRCVNTMKKLADHLKRKYPNELHTFFYVTEKNKDGGGYHSHFVYSIHNDDLDLYTLTYTVEAFIAKYNGRYQNQTLVEKFNHEDYFLEYMVKQMHKNPDHYGWLDHNLLV